MHNTEELLAGTEMWRGGVAWSVGPCVWVWREVWTVCECVCVCVRACMCVCGVWERV